MENHLQCVFFIFFYCFFVFKFLVGFVPRLISPWVQGVRVGPSPHLSLEFWRNEPTITQRTPQSGCRANCQHFIPGTKASGILRGGGAKPFGQQRTFFSRALIFISTSQYIFWMHAVLITTNVAPPLSSDGCSKSTRALEGDVQDNRSACVLLVLFCFFFFFFPFEISRQMN